MDDNLISDDELKVIENHGDNPIGFIEFLKQKPDLKRIIVLLIIISPIILGSLYPRLPYIESLVQLIMLPYLFPSMFLFGGWDVGGGLLGNTGSPGADGIPFLIGILFWYVIACMIVYVWNDIFKIEGKNSKYYHYMKILILIILVSFVLRIIVPFQR